MVACPRAALAEGVALPSRLAIKLAMGLSVVLRQFAGAIFVNSKIKRHNSAFATTSMSTCQRTLSKHQCFMKNATLATKLLLPSR